MTSLSHPAIRYRVPDKPYVVLKRADIEAVVADNRPVDDAILPKHRAGYSGIASLKHAERRENLFVPLFSGLNYEHIHDGTFQSWDVFFEPRRAAMELRVVDSATAELYQKSTPTCGLESCHRYHLLEDGTIEMTVEYVPRQRSFKHGYFGVFYACYIHQPESLDIHFKERHGQYVPRRRAEAEDRSFGSGQPRCGRLNRSRPPLTRGMVPHSRSGRAIFGGSSPRDCQSWPPGRRW